MFIAMVDPGDHLRVAGADHSRIAAIPDRQAPGAGGKAILSGLLGPVNIDAKVEKIRLSMEREKEPSWQDLKVPATGKIATIVWIGLALSVFQQFVGINVIFYYSNVLWQAVGFDESQSFIISSSARPSTSLTTLIAIATIDRIGRKPLLIIGSIGMTITLGTMAIIFGSARRAPRSTACAPRRTSPTRPPT